MMTVLKEEGGDRLNMKEKPQIVLKRTLQGKKQQEIIQKKTWRQMTGKCWFKKKKRTDMRDSQEDSKGLKRVKISFYKQAHVSLALIGQEKEIKITVK